jgi:hypothetical protein
VSWSGRVSCACFVFNQREPITRLDYLEAIPRIGRMLQFAADNDPPSLVTISKDGEFTNIL